MTVNGWLYNPRVRVSSLMLKWKTERRKWIDFTRISQALSNFILGLIRKKTISICWNKYNFTHSLRVFITNIHQKVHVFNGEFHVKPIFYYIHGSEVGFRGFVRDTIFTKIFNEILFSTYESMFKQAQACLKEKPKGNLNIIFDIFCDSYVVQHKEN